MLGDLTHGEQELVAEALRRDSTPLTRRERVAEGVSASTFVAVAALLVALQPPVLSEPAAAAACILVLAAATRVPFHIASGFTVPTQLAFIPLLFVMPASLVPFAVALALVLARGPEVLRRRTAPGRLVNAVGNAWFSVGPAAVLVASGTPIWEAGAPLIVAALLAQFAVDFAVSAARDAFESGTSVRDQLRETWVYAVDAALTPVALFAAFEIHEHPVAVAGLLPLLAVFTLFARERRARLESLVELKDAYHGTALVLGDVVSRDDGYTGEHCKNVVDLTLEVSRRMGLDAECRRNLEFGALLHDVGKIAIPNQIINKPGTLDAHEWTIVKTHTIEGQAMLDRVGGFMRQVGEIVRSHHERWDGSGYPDGLAGEEIPLEARIISCCDAWNAMRTDRAYRKALRHDQAVAELVRGAGSQFDPRIVDEVLAVVGRVEPTDAAELVPQVA